VATRIKDVRWMRLEGPDPHGIGGQPRTYSFCLLRVDAEDGTFGIGEAADFPGVVDVLALARAWLVGRDPLLVDPFVRAFLYGALPTADPLPAPSIMSPTATQTGPVAWGVAGVEMALRDLVGRLLGVPVHALLGGAFRDAVRVYLDRSGVADPSDRDAWHALGVRAAAEGFDWIKLDLEQIAPELTPDPWSRSLGSAQIDRIVDRVAHVREAVGDGVDIAIDGHMGFDVESAVRAAAALAPLRIRWLEDPVPVTSPAALADVRRRSQVPICAGEMFTSEQFRLFLDHGALDICHPDVLFTGGLGEARRVASLADLWYVPVAFHGNGGAVAAIATAHLAATVPNLLGMEYHFLDARWVGEIARRDVPLFRDGRVPLTDAPGLGLELDEAVCRRYLAPGSSWFGDA
jgi:L-alanine-DL-glutamate epimerase-like enolase superfamily enzyme